MTTLAERLQHFSQAYPVEVWPPMTEEERAAVGAGRLSRISADMGRHCGKIMLEAAQRITELEQELSDQHALVAKQAKLLSHTVNILRGLPPDLTTWSHHEAPELAAAAMKLNAQLGFLAKVVQQSATMLHVTSTRLLEESELYDRRTRDDEETAPASPRQFQSQSVSPEARPSAEG